MLRRLGTVLHISKRGSIILRTDKTPPIGRDSIVVDKKISDAIIGQTLYLYKKKQK